MAKWVAILFVSVAALSAIPAAASACPVQLGAQAGSSLPVKPAKVHPSRTIRDPFVRAFDARRDSNGNR